MQYCACVTCNSALVGCNNALIKGHSSTIVALVTVMPFGEVCMFRYTIVM